MKISYIVNATKLAAHEQDKDKFLFETLLEELNIDTSNKILGMVINYLSWHGKFGTIEMTKTGGFIKGLHGEHIRITIQPVLDVDGTFFKLEEVTMRVK